MIVALIILGTLVVVSGFVAAHFLSEHELDLLDVSDQLATLSAHVDTVTEELDRVRRTLDAHDQTLRTRERMRTPVAYTRTMP